MLAGHLARRKVAAPDPDDPRNRTGWRFDLAVPDGRPGFVLIPRSMLAHVAAARLKPIDLCIYAASIRRSGPRGWCDSSKHAVARAVGRHSEATVRRSWRRLEALGYTRRDRAPGPDAAGRPDATGWRTSFPALARDGAAGTPPGGGKSAPGPIVPGGGADLPPAPICPKLDSSPEGELDKTSNVVGSAVPGGERDRPQGPAPILRDAGYQAVLRLRCRSGGAVTLLPDGRGMIRAITGGCEPLTDAERAMIVGNKPAILAYLESQDPGRAVGAERAVVAGVSPAGEGPAPGVGRGRRGELLRAAGRLGVAGDPSEAAGFAELLWSTFRDPDEATSKGLYRDLAVSVQAGRNPPGLLIAAIEVACGPRVRNRGASFTASVKRQRASMPWLRPGGSR